MWKGKQVHDVDKFLFHKNKIQLYSWKRTSKQADTDVQATLQPHYLRLFLWLKIENLGNQFQIGILISALKKGCNYKNP